MLGDQLKPHEGHSTLSTIAWVTFLTLPILGVACGSDSGEGLFGGSRPKTDTGNTGGTGGGSSGSGAASGTGAAGTGTGGTGARSSGGAAGTGDASAGTSGSGAGGINGASGASGAGGAKGSGGAGGSGGANGSGGGVGTAGSAGSGAMDGGAGRDGSAGTSGSGGTVGTGGVAGSGGTAGTNGASGTAGTGGSGGPDASGGTAGADAGPKTCTNNGDCKNEEFCAKLSCAFLDGECQPRPKLCATTGAPVCGCDNVNYWNDCLREQAGIASSVAGECPTPATCGGLVGRDCPNSRAFCAHLFAAELECGVSDAFGACWVIPEQCPQIVVGQSHRPCAGTDRCVSKCEAIRSQHGHFVDSTCPQ